MTEEECINKLCELQNLTYINYNDIDLDRVHNESDLLIGKFLKENGFEKLSKLYIELMKTWWYS